MTLADGGLEHDAAGFVLAGGQSSRMGQDKALVEFAGQPLVVRAIGVLREAGLVAAIAGARSSLAAFAPVVEDLRSLAGQGPLSGICSAMTSITARYAVFLPVDLPLLPSSLISYLLNHARVTGSAVTVASVNGFAQTFPAVVDRMTLPLLQTHLEKGSRGCFSGFEFAANSLGQTISILPVEVLVQSGHLSHPSGLPATLWFLNVNGRQNLARAEALVARPLRVS